MSQRIAIILRIDAARAAEGDLLARGHLIECHGWSCAPSAGQGGSRDWRSTRLREVRYQEGSIASGGAALYYREAGRGRPLVLIHGTGADADTWTPVWDQLASRVRVIAYDRRSYTRSVGAPLNDLARHVDDAEVIIRDLGLDSPIVVGWSAGGTVAMGLATKRPDLVGAMVLEETVGPWFSTTTPSIAAILFRARFAGIVGQPEAGAEAFYRWAGRNDELGNAFDRLTPAEQAAMKANAKSAVAKMGMLPWQAVSQREVRSIRCPVTCLVGKVSHAWYRRVALRVCKLAPRATLETIAGAGHFMHVDAPDAFVSSVAGAAAA
jgi:pimeloyl-ACP methyl ester carboxylesterase